MSHTVVNEHLFLNGYRKLTEIRSIGKAFGNEVSLDENFLEAFRILYELIFVQAGLQFLFCAL